MLVFHFTNVLSLYNLTIYSKFHGNLNFEFGPLNNEKNALSIVQNLEMLATEKISYN